MIVLSSKNGEVGIRAAMAVLEAGGTSLDAVEAGIRLVEENPEDHSVGYGGYPNILGEVELDASIMDGSTLAAGSVGCLKGFLHPISVARRVMEKLPHVFLVGDGAARFAAEYGFEQTNLLTDEAQSTWHKLLSQFMPAEVFTNLKREPRLTHWVDEASSPDRVISTVNFIACDDKGNIASGVSTSGWFAKYPGRLGDSPIIGAGNYADNRYGAAACTGLGEMSIRASTARSVVFYMKMGFSLEQAGIQAMRDLNDLGGNYIGDMNIVAMDRNGNPAGFTSEEGKNFVYMTEYSTEPVIAQRIYVPINKRWEKRSLD